MLNIYCDGACSGNPGAGGWAAILIWQGELHQISGHEEYTTNNRMELMAAIQAFEWLDKEGGKKEVNGIAVYTDSTYLQQGITIWIHNWKRTGWRKGTIKNADLWIKLDELSQKYMVNWHWVRGHSGDKYNDMADRLARAAIVLKPRA